MKNDIQIYSIITHRVSCTGRDILRVILNDGREGTLLIFSEVEIKKKGDDQIENVEERVSDPEPIRITFKERFLVQIKKLPWSAN